MKVIFLDFDGVLNSKRTKAAFGALPKSLSNSELKLFDQVAIALVRNFCKHHDVKIVVSSSWRANHSPAYMAKRLRLPIIGSTPSFPSDRGDQIAAWINANPAVTKYAIIDDMAHGIREEQLPFFVLVNSDDGLVYPGIVALCKIFNMSVFSLKN